MQQVSQAPMQRDEASVLEKMLRASGGTTIIIKDRSKTKSVRRPIPLLATYPLSGLDNIARHPAIAFIFTGTLRSAIRQTNAPCTCMSTEQQMHKVRII